MPQLLIASNNRHKVDEIIQILQSSAKLPEPLEILCAADFPDIPAPEETGATFLENALIKAQAYAHATGILTLADDSGLAVEALGGRPGVQSARYAETTEARNAKVLEEMIGVPSENRGAAFVCVIALADGEGKTLTREGTVHGRITDAPRGANGFGYDPIFELMESDWAGQTTAELAAEQKNAISHRGRALQATAPALAQCLARGRI